jgi:transcriptional regulator with XRE-family HTH domain
MTLRAYAPNVYTLSRRQSTSHGVGPSDSHREWPVTAGLGDKERQVGQQVQRLRIERGLSQHQLAEQMKPLGPQYEKWRQSTIYKIEHGDRPLRINEMFDLAGVLRVPPEVLLAFDVDADVLNSQIAETEALLKVAERDHEIAAKHLRDYYQDAAITRQNLELRERDEAMRATRYRAALEVLYRMRADQSAKDDG